MWPVRVVLDPPVLDNELGLGEVAELLDVEAFVAEPAVAADLGNSPLSITEIPQLIAWVG